MLRNILKMSHVRGVASVAAVSLLSPGGVKVIAVPQRLRDEIVKTFGSLAFPTGTCGSRGF